MLYNVSQLMREPTGAIRQYDVDDAVPAPFGPGPDLRVRGHATLVRTPRGLVVRAHLDGDAVIECGRCLTVCTTPIEFDVDEEFFPTVDPFTGAKLPPPEDENAFLIDDAHHLDLTEAVRQAASLTEPMQPLCRDDCRGLCPSCGADLNAGSCTCNLAPVDARWAALRALSAGGADDPMNP